MISAEHTLSIVLVVVYSLISWVLIGVLVAYIMEDIKYEAGAFEIFKPCRFAGRTIKVIFWPVWLVIGWFF